MGRAKHLAYTVLCLSLVMLFFTFFAWGWFSDARGFDAYFEIPIGTEHGTLSTIADALWMATPFVLLISSLFILSANKIQFAKILAPIPLSLYALLQIVLFLDEKEGHFSVLITLFFVLLTSALTFFSARIPELGRFAGQCALFHLLCEIVLLICSLVFEEKYSQFYFSQLLPMGHYSGFRYSFFLISVFLYYLSHSLFLVCLNFCKTSNKDMPKKPEEKEQEASEPAQDPSQEEGDIPLTLADFGIEK